jgi:hypothetical protein
MKIEPLLIGSRKKRKNLAGKEGVPPGMKVILNILHATDA